jgi:2-octaprenyl-6-methoxyphenol hydroxylase
VKKNTDIIVIGSGMAGLAQSALLAQVGFAVTVVDREDPAFLASEAFDSRTVALSQGTKDILAPLNVWKKWEHAAQAITEIDVQEGHDPFVLNFRATDSAAPAFGWILPNTLVRKVLYDAARASGVQFVTGISLNRLQADDKKITSILDDKQTLTAQLLIGADGRFSRVRALTGVPTVEWNYKQTALVGLVTHEKPHHGLAVERCYTDGPFAVLPFTDDEKGRHRSAIVWTHSTSSSSGLTRGSSLDSRFRGNDGFFDLQKISDAILPFFDERYGVVEAVGKWAAYPLTFNHAKKMIAPRVALISDAAHGMHPIAGQGLNVGMRDVARLAEILASEKGNDIGAAEVLEKYQRARRFDVMAMMASTDILNRLFGKKFFPVRRLRSAGLGLVDRVKPLKRFFTSVAMGK